MKKDNTSFQLGVATGNNVPSKNQAETQPSNNNVELVKGANSQSDENLDFFIKENGMSYAGTHLTLDLWGATNLDNIEHIRSALIKCAQVSGATILHDHLHHFTPNGGVSGVLVLSESHISIHTWPERNFAALDIFMCGDATPKKAIPVLQEAFNPEHLLVNDLKRGMQHDK